MAYGAMRDILKKLDSVELKALPSYFFSEAYDIIADVITKGMDDSRDFYTTHPDL